MMYEFWDIVRHYVGHYGSLAVLWYWAQPVQVELCLMTLLILAWVAALRILWTRMA